jgi:hypothetical protein
MVRELADIGLPMRSRLRADLCPYAVGLETASVSAVLIQASQPPIRRLILAGGLD